MARAPKRATLPISEITANPRSDRVRTRAQLELLKVSITKFGQVRPVLCRAANRMIIAGHAVHLAMTELGRTEIDCLLWDVDQATADQFLVADNRFGELPHSDGARRRDLLVR